MEALTQISATLSAQVAANAAFMESLGKLQTGLERQVAVSKASQGCLELAFKQIGELQNRTYWSGRRLGAAVFALILGWCGGHWFYLGRTGRGLLHLFFCWTLIPAAAAFIRALHWLIMSDEAFQRQQGGALT